MVLEPWWYLATSLSSAKSAVSWYWQRGWIEQSFKDSKSLFGLSAGLRLVHPRAPGEAAFMALSNSSLSLVAHAHVAARK